MSRLYHRGQKITQSLSASKNYKFFKMLPINKKQVFIDRQKLILLGLLNICSLINISSSAPLSNLNQSQSRSKHMDLSPPPSLSQSSSSLPTTTVTKKQTLDDGGNPSELAWQAWLLFDNEGESDARSASDSAMTLRRITPKSIFLAPLLPACAEGYESDGMGRCVKKNLELDHDAHLDFLLQRLTAMYANRGQTQSASQQPESTPLSSSLSQPGGPFQLNIPLVLDMNKNEPPKSETLDTEDPEKSFSASALNEKSEENISIPDDNDDDIVTLYEIKDTNKQVKLEKNDEKIILVESQSDKEKNNNITALTSNEDFRPIVEIIQENNSNTSNEDENTSKISMNKEENSTKLTINLNDDSNSEFKNNDKVNDHVTTSDDPNVSIAFVVPVRHRIPSVIPLSSNTNMKTVVTAVKNYEGKSDIQFKNFSKNPESLNESIHIEVTASTPIDGKYVIKKNGGTMDYVDDNVDEHKNNTDQSKDFDLLTESDEEILEHSEAGITVTIPPISMSSDFIPQYENKNITAPNVSSIVIIGDDFIRETTMLGFNVDTSLNISQDSLMDDQKKLFDSNNEEEVTIIIPTTQIVTESTLSQIETTSIINSNNEQSTESSSSKTFIIDDSPNNFKTETFPVTTKSHEISTNTDSINPVVTIEAFIFKKDQKNDTEASDSSEMMTASSTNFAKVILSHEKVQDVVSSTSTTDELHDMKVIRASNPARLEQLKKNFLPNMSPPNDDHLYNFEATSQHYPSRHNYEIDANHSAIRPINNQYLASNNNRRPTFRPNNFNHSHNSSRDYVRFPTYKRPQSRPGHVRFPSDEANSIHTSDNLKDRYDYRPYAPSHNRESLRTGTTDPKQLNWHASQRYRSNRQQPLSHRSRSNANVQRPRERPRILMKVWEKMPLVKDPSLRYHPTYPTVVPLDTAKQHNNEPLHSSRAVNFYNEMSPHGQTRTFAQHSSTEY